jgi:hypothetical protein
VLTAAFSESNTDYHIDDPFSLSATVMFAPDMKAESQLGCIFLPAAKAGTSVLLVKLVISPSFDSVPFLLDLGLKNLSDNSSTSSISTI